MTLFQNPFAKLGRRAWGLYICSLCVVTVSALFGDGIDLLSLATSLVGVTALILLAVGDVWGQILSCLFALLYATVSLRLHYYGEAITYLCMSAPASFCSVISWMRHPAERGKNVVKIRPLRPVELFGISLAALGITAGGYFVLAAWSTPQLPVATFSLLTSFFASALMFFRSPYYAIAYTANDAVLIVLWGTACFADLRYLSVVACFVAFLANDLFAFVEWRKRQKKQNGSENVL